VTLKNQIFPHLIFLIFFFLNTFTYGQHDQIAIAHEYYSNSEYEKAREIFEKLSKKVENLPGIYSEYSATLLGLKEYIEAERFIKKTSKSFPDNIFYKIDHYVVLSEYLNSSDAEKEFDMVEKYVKNNTEETKRMADYLLKKNKPEKALSLYLLARKYTDERHLFAIELANIYRLLNKEELMTEELLEFLKANPSFLESVKNAFQNNISDKKSFENLEGTLYDKIQKDPDEITYNELLLWLNIQQKEFGKAYTQARAIDKRIKSDGNKLLEVGKIALENRDYENAQRYFQTIVNDYKAGINYPAARKLLISTKEENIKNAFPIERAQIISLIEDYRKLIAELGKNTSTLEALRSMALLEAFYLDNKDTAIHILEEAVLLAKNNNNFLAKAKLDMADIYLLKGEPWETTLLYSQVEKSQKDEPLGHEAKLKNAKLSYYKGDFELAQEHLDVLKTATSREIANDAMNLSILIQDNTALDTSALALKEYAAVDLLLFQNKIEEALATLNKMEEKYKGHSLSDEILFLKSKIYRRKGEYENAVNSLNKITEHYSEDILGDDALFMLGSIYEDNIKDKEKAMEIYQNFLIKYPGSIYSAEARKKFRILRGDKI
jgi:tetratricopeptide (TPR) repeat protein